MKRLFAAVFLMLTGVAGAATLVPPSLINPAGSTSGQAIVSNGPSTAPAWKSLTLDGVSGLTGTGFVMRNGANSYAVQSTPLPVASGGTGAASAASALTSLGAAPLASPALTGTPTAPTAAGGTNTTQLATTAFVQSAVSSGGVTRAKVFAVNTSGQSVPNNTNTVVTNWTELADPAANFAPTTGVFTVPRTGFYQISAAVGYVSSAFAAGQNVAVIVNKNGSAVVQSARTVEVSVTTPQYAPPISVLIPANAGDTLSVATFQNSGAAVLLNSGGTLVWLSISEAP